MKLNTIFLILITTLCTLPLQAQEDAATILKKAVAQAKAEHKNVFVKYGASWCKWCKKMDMEMKSDACKAYFDNHYVIVDFVVNESSNKKNLETPGAMELLQSWHGEKAGLPFWVVLDDQGALLEDSFDEKGQNLGCPVSPKEVAQFVEILKKTSTLKQKELNVITTVFTSK